MPEQSRAENRLVRSDQIRSCLGGRCRCKPGSVGVRRFLVGVCETSSQSAAAAAATRAATAIHPGLEVFSAVPEIRIVIGGVLTLVAAESAAELLLALRALVHEATCALGTAEATGALGRHAEATETGLNARRGLAVP